MNNLNFRLATCEDFIKISQLYKQATSQPYCLWDEYYPNKETILTDYESNNLLVLAKENQIIGAISISFEKELEEHRFWQYKQNVCEISRVVIDQHFQNQGYATYMVLKLEKEIKTRKYEVIHLLAGISNNQHVLCIKNLVMYS